MKVTLRVVLEAGLREVEWPAVPRVGDDVELADGRSLTVRRVVWYEDAAESTPYVILGDDPR